MDAKIFSPVKLFTWDQKVHPWSHPSHLERTPSMQIAWLHDSLFSNGGSSISRHQEHQHLKQEQQHGEGDECEHLDENLDINLYEEHWQCHRKICISLESYMAVTHLQVVERQNSLRQKNILYVRYIARRIPVNLTKKFVTVVKNPKPGGDHCFHCLRTSLKLPSYCFSS